MKKALERQVTTNTGSSVLLFEHHNNKTVWQEHIQKCFTGYTTYPDPYIRVKCLTTFHFTHETNRLLKSTC